MKIVYMNGKQFNIRNVSRKNQAIKLKTPIPVKLNNCFDSLTVRCYCNIDTSNNKYVTPKRSIPNAKPNCSHYLKNPSNTNHQNKRPQVAITVSYMYSQ